MTKQQKLKTQAANLDKRLPAGSRVRYWTGSRGNRGFTGVLVTGFRIVGHTVCGHVLDGGHFQWIPASHIEAL